MSQAIAEGSKKFAELIGINRGKPNFGKQIGDLEMALHGSPKC